MEMVGMLILSNKLYLSVCVKINQAYYFTQKIKPFEPGEN